MVGTELELLQTFDETGANLLGKQIGGANAIRYAGATRIEILSNVVDSLPTVNRHRSITGARGDQSFAQAPGMRARCALVGGEGRVADRRCDTHGREARLGVIPKGLICRFNAEALDRWRRCRGSRLHDGM